MDTGYSSNSLPGERLRILIVDDDKVTRDLLREIFERENYEVELVPSGEAALSVLRSHSFPIVLSDIRMFDVNGLELLSQIKKSNNHTVVILMTGFGTMEGAIKAIQEGAFDYISKPFKLNELKAVIGRAAEHWRALAGENTAVDPDEAAGSGFAPKTLIGKSPLIVEVYKTLARATMSNSNVLIIGESGTGKELVARGIHDNSTRRNKRFVAVNCGALAENLLESELFGHLKGSFTGAIANKPGLFEDGNGGTIFLDEIGDISPGMQVKLLRVLQEGEYKPVGSTETKKTDVRIIAATHANLENNVRAGTFREDLYYRLKVILIELPPLRDRIGDLPDLVDHFVNLFSEKTRKKISHISDDAMKMMNRYSWPGNVRELEHAIERAIAMTRTTVLYPEDFPPEIGQEPAFAENLEKPAALGQEIPPDSLEEVEKAHILKVLEDANYNKSKAAAILGIDRKTLHRKAQRYQIELNRKRP
jgi:two-component system, NtrC family, response regulator AtoC